LKIAVIGETRLPVLPFGPGGLGRATHEIATELLHLGHDVTLFAPEGSQFDGDQQDLNGWRQNPAQFDAILDYSHEHLFSQNLNGHPVLNLIGDRECQWQPPNAIVESHYMQSHYPAAKIVPAGIDVDSIPFCDTAGDYLVFMGLDVWHKQPHIAREAAKLAGKRMVQIGPGGFSGTPDYLGILPEPEKWEWLGGALGLLAPYTIDASPRSPLEAAACGTPTLCLNGDGTRDHVKDGLTGFICANSMDMAERVKDLGKLKRENIRIWVKQNHDIGVTIKETERMLQAVAGGERW
jgi:glycosyltransferase involved in cell wall biosynthesis